MPDGTTPEHPEHINNEGERQAHSFADVAREVRVKRETTTPNPPFPDEKSQFEEEAPTVAQRRLAFDFYNELFSLFGNRHGKYTGPSVLDIIELHQLHLEAIRDSVPPGDIVPEYTLAHVVGAGKRLQAVRSQTSQQATGQEEMMQGDALFLLERAAQIEPGYPLVSHEEATDTQQRLWENAQAFLKDHYPAHPYVFPSRPFTREDARTMALQCFPEEHPEMEVRRRANACFHHLVSRLRFERDAMLNGRPGQIQPFGGKEVLAQTTQFAHDNHDKYNFVNVYGAAKRTALNTEIKLAWNDNTRDIFAVHKVLKQAVTERHLS